jgi:alcohol dehydrogenase class IV
MLFEFATAGRILFGPGKRQELGALALGLGRRVVVITGSRPERSEFFFSSLKCGGADYRNITIDREPTVPMIAAAVEEVRGFWAEVVVGIGGGSVLDAGKAIAALATNSGDIFDYLEVIGRAQPLENEPLPYIAVPTTAGTGAEVTRNAVLSAPGQKVKVSLRSPLMLPRIALVDPELALDLPSAITAYTGLDALTQLIEAFLCTRANPFTDALCREAIPRAATWLAKAVHEPGNLQARTEMALASLFSGLALANAGLGAVHGFAAAIGGMYPAPHGAVCAALLAPVLEINYAALKARAPGSHAVERFRELADLLTGMPEPEEGLRFILELTSILQVPTLSKWGLSKETSSEICDRAQNASSMKANPVHLSPQELQTILSRAL